VLTVKDRAGDVVVPVLLDDTMLPPPRGLDDPSIFVQLIEDNSFGTGVCCH
jgi:hypothetical protein